MKKIFFAALAAVALTACVADVVTEEPTYAIDFVSNTKAGVKSLVKNAETFTAFRVFAFNIDETAGQTTTIMPNMLVKKEGDNWTYSPKKYWPASGYVDFYGVSIIEPQKEVPGAEAVTVAEYDYSYQATADAGLSFTINMNPDATGTKGVNPSAGVNAANIPDVVYAAAMKKTKALGKVNMTFRHAMAQVDFKMSNITDLKDEVTVTSGDVYVESLKCDGTYTVGKITTTADANSPTGNWDLENARNLSYLFPKNVKTFAAGDESQSILNDDCIVFPQTTTGEVTFRVWCTIKQKDVVIFDDYKIAKVKVDWKQGHKYIYTFVLEDDNLIGNLINISATVVDYTDVKYEIKHDQILN